MTRSFCFSKLQEISNRVALGLILFWVKEHVRGRVWGLRKVFAFSNYMECTFDLLSALSCYVVSPKLSPMCVVVQVRVLG